MPQSSYIFACARVRAHEARLLSPERASRIADAKTADEALKVLIEAGYGGNMELSSAYDFQRLIDEEMVRTYELIEQITPNKAVTDLFLVQYDFHNLKALYKSRLLETEDDSMLIKAGTVDVARIAAAVRDKDYRPLPKYLADALMGLDQKATGRVNPQALDTFVDQAMFTHIFEVLRSKGFKKNLKHAKFLKQYFEARADLTNVAIVLRGKSAKLSREELSQLLMPEGKISKRALLEAFDQPAEGMTRLVAVGDYQRLVMAGLEEYSKTGSVAAIERMSDDYMLGLVMKYKFNAFSIEPLLCYLLSREQESRVVRLIMTAKLNNIPGSVVQERLRELYV